MSRILRQSGFGPDLFPENGVILAFDQLWTGQDLPIEVPLGVAFPVDGDAADLAPWLNRLSLIVLPFEKSADGRAFSIARQLRQLGYTGTIRAEGHVLVDQFRAALKVGIDEIVISDTEAERNPEPVWMSVTHNSGYLDRVFAAE